MAERFLWEILVPTVRREDGRPYRARFHRVWDRKVREISGGLTLFKPVKGQWLSSDGELFDERMIPVRFIGTEEEKDLLVDFTAVYYDQLAVLAYKIATNVTMRTLEEAKANIEARKRKS